MQPKMSRLVGGGGGVGHVIFSLHLGVGHSVLCQMEEVGHVFSSQHIWNCSGPLPPSPVLVPVPKVISQKLKLSMNFFNLSLTVLYQALFRKNDRPPCSLKAEVHMNRSEI